MDAMDREFQLQIANAERRWARRPQAAEALAKAAVKVPRTADELGGGYARAAPRTKRLVRPEGDERPTLVSRRAVPLPDADATAVRIEIDTSERILDDNDLLSYGFLQRGFQIGRAVGRVHIRSRSGRSLGFGTGFLISPRLLVTNNHVLKSANRARESVLELDYVHTRDGGASAPVVVRIVPDEFWVTSPTLDYTVVAVAPRTQDGRAVRRWGYLALAGRTSVEKDDPVNIIQHPGGQPKQIAIRANKVVDVDGNFVRYRTDTAPGTSGGPLHTDRWELAGVHHSGVPQRDAQGRILAVGGGLWDPSMGDHRIHWVSNEGIVIDAIAEDLRSRRLTAGAQALLDAALDLEPLGPPSEDDRGDGGDALVGPDERSEARHTVHADGGVSLTIPLHVSLRLGGTPGAGASVRVTDAHLGPLPADGTSTPPGDDGPQAADVEAAVRALRERTGLREDVLEIRSGWLFEDGWITDTEAIEVVVREKLLPGELAARGIEAFPATFQGYPIDIVAATPAEMLGVDEDFGQDDAQEATTKIDYVEPEHLSLDEVHERMRVIAHTSPDAGFAQLESFLRRTETSLAIAMYDFTAPHILDVLLDHFGGNEAELRLVIQRGSAGGGNPKVKEKEALARLKNALGDRFHVQHAAVGSAGDLWATSYHIKVAVRDEKEFWLSSGNWQSSGQPELDPIATGQTTWGVLSKANREWHAVVRNTKLAKMFAGYIDYDFEESRKAIEGEEAAGVLPPDLFVPEDWFAVDDTFAFEGRPTWFAPLELDRKIRVQPLLTPDNYAAEALKLIRSAKERVWFQNQTLGPKPSPTNAEEFFRLLDALRDQQRADLDVRIIFRDIGDTRDKLRKIKKFGFDMDQVRVHRACHTKGIVIDDRAVLVGSHNWSEKGTLFNRDASLIFYDKKITSFFADILDWDWDNRARQKEFSELFVPRVAGEGEEAPPGYRRITWRDYYDA